MRTQKRPIPRTLTRRFFVVTFLFLTALATWLAPRLLRPTRTQLTVALLDASRAGDTPRVQELLAQGADVNGKRGDVQPGTKVEDPGYVNFVDPATPLVEAVNGNHAETCEVLLQHGANPNISDGNEMPLISLAGSVNSRRQIVRILLNHGANINAGIRKKSGFSVGFYTVLFQVVKAQDAELVRYLLAHGAKISYDVMQVAIQYDDGKVEILQTLLDAGGWQALTKQERVRLLAWAAKGEPKNAVKLLKKYSAKK